jgi:taurine dioxygenase
MTQLQVRRISYALGAEVRGVDLRRSLDDDTFAQIHQAWLDHSLLCFPGQDLEKEDLLAFTRRFGIIELKQDNFDPDVPEMLLLTNKPVNGKPWDGYKCGPTWHADGSYRPCPTAAIFINAKEIPEVGGDTLFASMYMAYEALSPAMQQMIDPLWAVHDRGVKQIPEGMALLAPHLVARAEAVAAKRAAAQPPTAQPVVRTHTETKRKSLFLTDRARHFIGMTVEESQPLITFLNQHSVRYEFTYRHRWTAGDLIMWDNRCLLHRAPCDYDLERDIRHMYRTSVGDEATGYALPEEALATT